MTVMPDQLRRIEMFDGLEDAELNEISGCFTEMRLAADERLYGEGEAASSACFLKAASTSAQPSRFSKAIS